MNNKNILNINKYWFLLGGFPLISTAEIKAVLELNENEYQLNQRFLFCDKKINEPNELMKKLGGTVKIANFIDTAINEEELENKITTLLAQNKGKIIFGVSAYFGDSRKTSQWVYNLGKKIKEQLKKSGLSCRYVFNREATLSSVTVQKNNLIEKGFEFLIIKKDEKYFFSRTVAIQPFEEWGQRDYGRPGRDSRSGMLPPKLARMMINLSEAKLTDLIIDPFCGSGTILTEAVLLGFKKIIGSDISEKAIKDSRQNIDWLKSNNNVKIFQSNSSELSQKINSASVDAIITEPYLGKPLKGRESKDVLSKQAEELKNLYLKTFGEFQKILKPGGSVIFIIPCFKIENKWLRIDFINNIKKLGFLTEPFAKNSEFLLYARPDQKVGREIWKFKKLLQ